MAPSGQRFRCWISMIRSRTWSIWPLDAPVAAVLPTADRLPCGVLGQLHTALGAGAASRAAKGEQQVPVGASRIDAA